MLAGLKDEVAQDGVDARGGVLDEDEFGGGDVEVLFLLACLSFFFPFFSFERKRGEMNGELGRGSVREVDDGEKSTFERASRASSLRLGYS